MTADTTTETIRGKGSYFGPGGKFEKDSVPPESTDSKNQIEKDLEETLTREFIKKYADDNGLEDLTEKSHIGPFEFLVYKHQENNMLYFLRRTNPEEKDEKKAQYSLQMCVAASSNNKY